MAEIMALLASMCFAVGTVLQQKGTLETAGGADDPRFLVQVLRRPVWLVGGLLQAAGWILQAAALDRGSLVVVQSICTLSLVFALPVGMRVTHQRVGRREVTGALAVVAGIVAFVSVAQPSAGTTNPSATAWWTAGLLIAAAIGVLMGLGWSGTGGRQALLFGLAAGCAFAFQAAVTKVFVGILHQGLGPILSSWTTYALIISALLGFTLQQSALKTGRAGSGHGVEQRHDPLRQHAARRHRLRRDPGPRRRATGPGGDRTGRGPVRGLHAGRRGTARTQRRPGPVLPRSIATGPPPRRPEPSALDRLISDLSAGTQGRDGRSPMCFATPHDD